MMDCADLGNLAVSKRKRTVAGCCNSCNSMESDIVYEITFARLSFRVCTNCKNELIGKLKVAAKWPNV